MMRTTAAAGAVLVLVLTGYAGGGSAADGADRAGGGDGGGLLDSTGSVCDEFARYVRDGQPTDRRSEVVSSIGGAVGNAEQGVREAHQVLARSVDGPASQWTVAADTFAQACFDAGWDG